MGLFAGTQWDRVPHCDRCDKPEPECTCPPIVTQPTTIPPEKQTARLSVERRKKGKVVTVVRGLSSEANDLPTLLTKLKNSCGAGGTIEDDSLEIQGDHLERLKSLLGGLGYMIRS